MFYEADFLIFRQINNLAGKFQFFDWLGIFGAKYLIFACFFIFAAVCLYYFKKGGIMPGAKAFLACVFAWLANQVIGLAYFRPRPFVYHAVSQLIEKSPLDKSFPSDHTAVAFAIAFSAYFFNKKAGAALLALAALIGLSRIFVGVHYPGDILAGGAVGYLSAILAKKTGDYALTLRTKRK